MRPVLKAAAALVSAQLALVTPAGAEPVASRDGAPLDAINCTSPNATNFDEEFWLGFPVDSPQAAFQMAHGDVLQSTALLLLKDIQMSSHMRRADAGAFGFGLPASDDEFRQWAARRDGRPGFNIFNAKTHAGYAEFQLSSPDASTRQLQVNVWRARLPSEEPEDGSGIVMRFARSEVSNAWRLQALHFSSAVPTQGYGLFAGIPFEELVARRARQAIEASESGAR
jgi:hypothetical protein